MTGEKRIAPTVTVTLSQDVLPYTESGCKRSVKTRTLKGGALADKARLRGLKAKTDF